MQTFWHQFDLKEPHGGAAYKMNAGRKWQTGY